MSDAARALVDDYAPGAPQSIRDQAAELVDQVIELAPEVDLRDGGQGATYPQPAQRNPILHSSAGALLAPYRRPRARVIE